MNDADENGIPDFLEARPDDVPASDFILQGGRGVGCHVGVTRQSSPTGVLLLMLALCLGIRRYRRY
jgi:hypothetical protein